MIWLLLSGCSDKVGDTGPAVDTSPADPDPVICTATIPSNVWVVTGWEETTAAGAVAWICSGAQLTVGGPGGAFFVASGGQLNLNAADALVYATDGSSVAISQSGVTVYYEGSAAIALETIATLEKCDEIQLDTSKVPIPCE